MGTGGRGKHRGGRDQTGEPSTELIDGHAASYVQRIVQCKNPRCKKCAEKNGGHGPYWYKIYRTPKGRVRTEYVGKVKPEEAE